MFGWTTIRKNDVQLNNDPEKYRSELWSFGNSTIWPCDDSIKWLSAIFFRQNDSAKLHYGKTTIRWNDVSGKWCGPVYSMWSKTIVNSTALRVKHIRYHMIWSYVHQKNRYIYCRFQSKLLWQRNIFVPTEYAWGGNDTALATQTTRF